MDILMSAEVADSSYDGLVDRDGTVWLFFGEYGYWSYLTDSGLFSDWDTRSSLPAELEPYAALDYAAVSAMRKIGMTAFHHTVK